MNVIQNKPKPALFVLLLTGLSLLAVYLVLYLKADYEVSGFIRASGYISFFIILISLYILLVKAKRLILSNVLFLFLLVLILEMFCFIRLGMPSAFKKDFSAPSVAGDHIAANIGAVPNADSVYHEVFVLDNDTVFDVKTTIDSNCKRFTPGHSKERRKHALFFGCSIAFGHGVQDNETMPYYFQEISNEYNAYNFGLEGHSTNHMLARLRYKPLRLQVEEKEGVGIYVFFWVHIYRSIGSMNRYCSWLHNAPYYYLDGDQLKRSKMFCDGRPFISAIYEAIYQTNIVKYFKLDFPVKIKRSHLNLVAEMVKESKAEYQRQFPGNSFYCVLYPFWDKHEGMIKEFKVLLEEKEVKCIDLTSMEYTVKQSLGGDGHPNPGTHQNMAQIILQKIRSNK